VESANYTSTGYGKRIGPFTIMWQRGAASFIRVYVHFRGHTIGFELSHS
jgi:hypothetical protein